MDRFKPERITDLFSLFQRFYRVEVSRKMQSEEQFAEETQCHVVSALKAFKWSWDAGRSRLSEQEARSGHNTAGNVL